VFVLTHSSHSRDPLQAKNQPHKSGSKKKRRKKHSISASITKPVQFVTNHFRNNDCSFVELVTTSTEIQLTDDFLELFNLLLQMDDAEVELVECQRDGKVFKLLIQHV
jgi:hypothetical protein